MKFFCSDATGCWLALVLTLAPLSAVAKADASSGIALKVLDASAPPGGSFQLSVTVTEPKPIIISTAVVPSSFELQGVVLPGSPDAAGAAVIGPGGVTLRTISPSGTMGMAPGKPIIALTFAVPSTMPRGATMPLALDASASLFLGLLGVYPQDIKQGRFTARGTLSISDVVPGGGLLPAGTTIRIVGTGFEPGALVEVDGVDVLSTRVVDSMRIDAVIGNATQLDGRRVIVRNPDATRAAYFSYLRARPLGESVRPLLAATEPVFPIVPLSKAVYPLPGSGPAAFFAIAAQNPGGDPSDLTVALRSADGGLVASTTFLLPAGTEISRELSELLGGVLPEADQMVVVTASSPVQMLGLAADVASAVVLPVLPAWAF